MCRMDEAVYDFQTKPFWPQPLQPPHYLLFPSQNSPNIVFILCDDLRLRRPGMLRSNIRTPNLNRLAQEGMRFTNFDSADPVCSPSRAALLTGRYPTRVGVPRVFFRRTPMAWIWAKPLWQTWRKHKATRQPALANGIWEGQSRTCQPTGASTNTSVSPYSNDMNPRVLLDETKVVENPASLDTLTQRYTEHGHKVHP